uniref:Uncharacterized protein n=1 Tax=Physcomitrium patens TaxID=3218 RepID=A0A2K1JX86_PHYPA|nr:hypothetical protein PHYPA_013228 [Physcomitrium patens]
MTKLVTCGGSIETDRQPFGIACSSTIIEVQLWQLRASSQPSYHQKSQQIGVS